MSLLPAIAQELVTRGARARDVERLSSALVRLALAADDAGSLVISGKRLAAILGEGTSRQAALRVRAALERLEALAVQGGELGVEGARVEIASWALVLVRDATRNGQASGQEADKEADKHPDKSLEVRSSLRSLSNSINERALSEERSEAGRDEALSGCAKEADKASRTTGQAPCPACPARAELSAIREKLSSIEGELSASRDERAVERERLAFLCDLAIEARRPAALAAPVGEPVAQAQAQATDHRATTEDASRGPRVSLWSPDDSQEEKRTSLEFAKILRDEGRDARAIADDHDEARRLPHERVRIAVASVLLKRARGKNVKSAPGLLLTLARSQERGEPGSDGAWHEIDAAIAAAREGLSSDGAPAVSKRGEARRPSRISASHAVATPEEPIAAELLARARRELEANAYGRVVPDEAVVLHAKDIRKGLLDSRKRVGATA